MAVGGRRYNVGVNRERPERLRSRTLTDLPPDDVKPVVEQYRALHEADAGRRKDRYRTLVEGYYDLATNFYEFGWGRSWHFAPRQRGESLKASLLRHQQYLADRLSLQPGMRVLDVGCGVGGPMGNLARYCGASFVGINSNAYQIDRAKQHTADVESLCSFIHGDFMAIPEPDDAFDAAMAIDATCHAPDTTAAFREIFRVLAPGAYFAGYDWCLTDRFDPQNTEHRKIKHGIMAGAGLPDIALTPDVAKALHDAGFTVLESADRATESHPRRPWYRPLQGRDLRPKSIPRTPAGRALTNLALRIAERMRLAPQGARDVSTMLNAGADALVAGGKTGIFTPMFFFIARKPGDAEG